MAAALLTDFTLPLDHVKDNGCIIIAVPVQSIDTFRTEINNRKKTRTFGGENLV